MMYLYPLAMSFLGEKHCNMFNADKEFVFVLYCITCSSLAPKVSKGRTSLVTAFIVCQYVR